MAGHRQCLDCRHQMGRKETFCHNCGSKNYADVYIAKSKLGEGTLVVEIKKRLRA